MTDEEKKAVDKINKLVKYLRKWNKNVTIVPEDIKYFEKILDMIKTYIRIIDENIEEILEQSKEIEGLKEKNEVLESKLIGAQILVAGNKDRYICKDKIREEIKELERDKKKLYKEQGNIEEIKIYSVIDIIEAEILRFKELLEEENV